MSAENKLSDLTTQRWVELTGKRIDFASDDWLLGPTGKPSGIGIDYFDRLAEAEGLMVSHEREGRGLIKDFTSLKSEEFDPALVDRHVVDFYEHTDTYSLDAWAEWAGAYRPFGGLLAAIFSRRLQQLNVPLSALDTSQGISSEIVQLIDPVTNEVRYTGWVRKLLGSGDVLYVGSYSTIAIPGHPGRCVKVVFPLPNGNAIVIMKPVAHPDGSFSVISSGRGFGDPGFYFTVVREGKAFARYVRSLRETITVYSSEEKVVRADHVLNLWGRTFMRLHYRMQKQNVLDRTVA